MEMSNNKGCITQYDVAYLVQSRGSTSTTLQIALKTCPTFNIFWTACVSYRSKYSFSICLWMSKEIINLIHLNVSATFGSKTVQRP